ncbi:unnamed protein product [Diatraea saccharalis]|uniref:Uncharacterized protein n=1 Tax=Diatraea saccharalis TaxID=40085 RepID=A0A9N9WBF4_9NEOP|nr:unnamed protein product [Diatraea saccharalis]
MSQRFQVTKWLWFLIAIYSGPTLSPVRCVSVKTPPKTPSTVEAQAKFFQDFFSVQLSPYKIEFGHVCEDPNTWEQRYEKKDYKNHRDMGKVRWGDKKGGYGEHYWDLNHAGHAGNHGGDDYSGNNHSDDGSYHDHDDSSPSTNYEGPSDHSYGTDDYDPEKSSYEENGRAKRAYPKIKAERTQKIQQQDEDEQEEEEVRPRNRKHKQQQEIAHDEDSDSEDEENEHEEVEEKVYKKSKRPQHRQKQDNVEDNPETPPKEPKKKVVLVVQEKENQVKNQYVPSVPTRQLDYTKYVPYEGGAGVRQHHHPEVVAAASVPRLFLEPTTGHVVDRATGQAYVLQPIAALGYN